MSLYYIERAEKIDLDKEFDRDGLESLLELYTYTEQDERDGRPNRTKILDESFINMMKHFHYRISYHCIKTL